MEEHTIMLTLTNDHAVPSVNMTIAKVGDTLQYDTIPPGLPFRVEMHASRLTKKPVRVIKDRKPRVLTAQGRFFCKCFVQRPSDKNSSAGFRARSRSPAVTLTSVPDA